MKRRTWMVAVALAGVILIGGGCKNYQRMYEDCMTEKNNKEGLYETAQAALDQANAKIADYETKLTAAQRELNAKPVAAPQKTGFEDQGNVKVDAARGTITVTLEDQVLFDPGKITLKTDAKGRLNKIAGVIKQKYAGKEVSVVGNTDNDPITKSKWQDNWQLSTERALAVTRFLTQEGVSPKKLIAAGRGEYNPVSSNKTNNRRVEIVVHMF